MSENIIILEKHKFALISCMIASIFVNKFTICSISIRLA